MVQVWGSDWHVPADRDMRSCRGRDREAADQAAAEAAAEEARKRFGNAKSISSAQYHNQEAGQTNHESQVSSNPHPLCTRAADARHPP